MDYSESCPASMSVLPPAITYGSFEEEDIEIDPKLMATMSNEEIRDYKNAICELNKEFPGIPFPKTEKRERWPFFHGETKNFDAKSFLLSGIIRFK
jgi:hypothetical protein